MNVSLWFRESGYCDASGIQTQDLDVFIGFAAAVCFLLSWASKATHPEQLSAQFPVPTNAGNEGPTPKGSKPMLSLQPAVPTPASWRLQQGSRFSPRVCPGVVRLGSRVQGSGLRFEGRRELGLIRVAENQAREY